MSVNPNKPREFDADVIYKHSINNIMNQNNGIPTPEELEIWQALDEIDKDPCIGRLTQKEKDDLFDQSFTKEATNELLSRVQKRKQAALEELEKILEMEKQLVESLQK